jgi:hypothetical protein
MLTLEKIRLLEGGVLARGLVIGGANSTPEKLGAENLARFTGHHDVWELLDDVYADKGLIVWTSDPAKFPIKCERLTGKPRQSFTRQETLDRAAAWRAANDKERDEVTRREAEQATRALVPGRPRR